MSRRLFHSGLPLLVVLALVPACQAGDDFADVRHTSSALQKIRADPQLKSLNLIVIVKNGVATLRGPVPSPELMRRAGLCVRQVPEIQDVRNECHLGTQFNPVMVAEPEPKKPLPEIVVKKDSSPGIWVPLGPDSLKIEGAKNKEKPRNDPPILVTILPPIQVEGPTELPQPEVIQPVSRPKDKFADEKLLRQQIQRMARLDSRFWGLRLEVHDGVVTISGVVSRWEDVHVLSRQLTKMPGVERVVWLTIRADGNR